jgi:hypothetical protein
LTIGGVCGKLFYRLIETVPDNPVPLNEDTMNTNIRRNRRNGLSFQVAAQEPEVKEPESKVVEENEYGKMLRSTFEITVKSKTDKDKDGNFLVKYSNKAEPYQYQSVETLVGALRYMGAKSLPDANIEALGNALTIKDDEDADKELGESVAKILKALNAKFKSDAKSSAYQGIVNKNTPLEGEQRNTAIARTINNMVKLTNLSAEEVIEILKAKKAVDDDYTVQEYRETPLRKTGGAKEEDEE